MRQKGNHTWDIIIDYHRCPSCGYIFESRKDYIPRFHQFFKTLRCKRCQFVFEEEWKSIKIK